MRRGLGVSLAIVVTLAVGSLAATLIGGHTPKLGLDLQGGLSVVLQPTHTVNAGVLKQAEGIIRNRVDALGVAEPDIHIEGSSIIVALPGVKNRQRALSLVGQTAELRFRPVLGALPAFDASPPSTTTTTAAPPTSAPPTPTTTPAQIPTTNREGNTKDATVVLPVAKETGRLQLGPSEMDGRAIKTARANFNPTAGQWTVDFTTTGAGSKLLSALSQKYTGKQVAIELDGQVKSAPQFREAITNGQGQISGSFSEKEAKDLALVLRYGSLPVDLKRATTQEVSATLGKDSLRAGLLAGLIGLGLVLLYMILYYRALGIVVLFGLLVSGMLMYSIVTFLGTSSGLALSLAGATGVIVSVGVTVDSYVVYFERLKDEIRSGKTIRSSVDRGFSRAYRTIIAADLVSLIGAVLLYFLAVGSVRGFAFFLGLSTVLDMGIAYFFTRPMVVLLGRNRLFTEARFFGVARGLAAAPAGGPS
ncbi:MAG: preprotein translocase subunit SecD [Acidimicrobiaceae bacterium]|nr:preprotein translocase subunit SecD [Acidimicrobiaceae bacterium]